MNLVNVSIDSSPVFSWLVLLTLALGSLLLRHGARRQAPQPVPVRVKR